MQPLSVCCKPKCSTSFSFVARPRALSCRLLIIVSIILLPSCTPLETLLIMTAANAGAYVLTTPSLFQKPRKSQAITSPPERIRRWRSMPDQLSDREHRDNVNRPIAPSKDVPPLLRRALVSKTRTFWEEVACTAISAYEFVATPLKILKNYKLIYRLWNASITPVSFVVKVVVSEIAGRIVNVVIEKLKVACKCGNRWEVRNVHPGRIDLRCKICDAQSHGWLHFKRR